MTTLKISELSVGDWVEIDHEILGWQIAQLSAVGDLGIGAYFKDISPEEEYECTLSQARPIPITAEMLEKNGFESSYSCWRIYKDNGGQIEIWEDENKWYLSVNCVEFILCDLHWVHQIQHLMRVWGFDKEINL